ncbi:alpha/beta hydrolase [Paludibacter sp. 221]|uniref:alpha/beta hydrolase n=1 Tax=Paludibacter sp. 221 TaxID=2302939 RepID=UPI0013D457A3|nr:alpha/beta hydrolase [Paludibacter sp. 221]NDV45768.1 alpha/beta hydrolase [Paludibacter sp. 221]
MKRIISSLALFLFFFINVAFGQWQPDVLGDGFEYRIIEMPDDYEGAVSCALVRSLPENPTGKAVLYVHGFNDYFFQKEQAQEYNKHGYAFFAVDLRKYGRAYMEHQRRGNVRNLKEYYPDIDSCLSIIRRDYPEVVLAAHSTGGLIASVYAHDYRENLPVQGIVLNSPFLDMNFPKFKEGVGVPLVSFLGGVFPKAKISSGEDTFYAQSIHQYYGGEWEYDLEWKPAVSIPVSFGWTRAIYKGHKKVQKGLDIPCPILVMHSDKSVYGNEFSDDFKVGDAVLDVEDIHKYAAYLGNDVTIVTIDDGVHDLVLSRKDVRETVYNVIFSWLSEQNL